MCIVELFYLFFFFKHKTAYEMRIRDCSSDVCSSDLHLRRCSRKSRPDLKETADKSPKLPGDFPERSADSTIAAALPDQLTYTVDLRRNLGKRGPPLGGGQQENGGAGEKQAAQEIACQFKLLRIHPSLALVSSHA